MTHRAYRHRFYPTKDQETLLRKTIGCVRFVYNKGLQFRSEAWRDEQRSTNYIQSARALTLWKKEPELVFLNDVSVVCLQQALRHLDTGYSLFFNKKSGHPRFKRRRHGGSATFVGHSFRFLDGRIKLARMDQPLDIRWSRPLPEGLKPSSVTVSLDPTGRWHISILVNEDIQHLPRSENEVGIDLGLDHLATLSTGEKVPNMGFDSKSSAKKKRLSRKLARQQKGSKNREKTRLLLAILHAKVADQRSDYLHKLSTRLVRENQTIVVENLNVCGMMKNHFLARSIGDASWSSLVSMLEYKCKWYGRDFVKIDRFYPSSKLCSCCGFKLDVLPLSIREWQCPKCSTTHDRDVNAALNILAARYAVTACGPDVRHATPRGGMQSGMKQETLSVRIP